MTKITLEMVDEVINRTGVSYKEAKDALEFCDGDILEAVVYIETSKEHGRDFKKDFNQKSNDIIEKAKELIKKGNVTNVLVEKEGKTYLSIPVTAGGIAALIFAGPTLVAIIAAIAVGCQLKIVKEDGEVININDLTEEKINEVKGKMDHMMKKTESTCCNEETPTAAETVEEDEEIIVEAKFMDEEKGE